MIVYIYDRKITKFFNVCNKVAQSIYIFAFENEAIRMNNIKRTIKTNKYENKKSKKQQKFNSTGNCNH